MNKDFIKTGVFAFFVSIVLLAAVFELKKFKEEEDTKEVKDRVVKVDDSDQVLKVEMGSFVFLKDPLKSTWRSVKPVADYMNFNDLEDWVSKALSFDGRLLSDEGEEINWVDFGLNESSKKIIYFEKSRKTEVSLSDKAAFDGSVYLKVTKDNKDFLYSSSTEWKEVFKKDPISFRSLKLFDWTVPEAKALPKILKVKTGSKEKLSLLKTGGQDGEVWKSLKHPKWTIDSAKVDSFLSDVRGYLHKGFADGQMVLSSPKVSLYIEDQTKNPFSLNLYIKDKKNYAVASYRPEHVLKVDQEAFEDLSPSEIEFRSLSDFIKDFDVDSVKALKVRLKDENKVFRLKNEIWTKTDGKKTPKGYEFNGAKVFKFLEQFKALDFKRYVLEKDVIFKSAKKKLYFYKNQKDVELTFSVGQKFPCQKNVKSKKTCVLIATNKVQGYYSVVLKSEIDKLFKYRFLDRNTKTDKKEADGK